MDTLEIDLVDNTEHYMECVYYDMDCIRFSIHFIKNKTDYSIDFQRLHGEEFMFYRIVRKMVTYLLEEKIIDTPYA